MTLANSQISERLAWDGAIGLPAAIGVGVMITLLAAWSLGRERRALGTGWVVGIFLLRVAAFGCALWMLAGPTWLHIEQRTQPQSIAIFADASQSMDVVDPPDPATALRWELAGHNGSPSAAVEICDRLGLALGVCLSDCERISQYVAEHRGVKQLETALKAAMSTLERAAAHADKLVASVDEPELAERAGHMSSLLGGAFKDSCQRLQDALAAPSAAGANETLAAELESLIDGLADAHRRTLVLGDDFAAHHVAQQPQPNAAVQAHSRRERASRALGAFEEDLAVNIESSVDIQRFSFDQGTTPVSSGQGWAPALAPLDTGPSGSNASRAGDPNDEGPADVASPVTNLTAVLRKIAEAGVNGPIRLAIILSDGRHNDAGALAPQDVAADLGDVPLYVVPIGNAIEMRDLLLHRVEAPSAVTEDDSAVIDVIVSAFACDGEASAVVLRRDGQEIERKPVAFAGGRSDSRVQFSVPAKGLGWQEYVVEVEPVSGEANSANNFLPVSFEVVRDRIRVLLADGLGRWEYLYLNQLFRRESHLEFDELLFLPRLHGTGALADRPAFPREVEGWARYDIVILGDVNERQLPAESQRSLDEYVRTRGGRLIVVAGRDAMPAAFKNTPLMELLPVERSADVYPEQGYALELTDEGSVHSALMIADAAADSREAWQQVYRRFPVYALSEYCRPKPTARTLIEAVQQGAGQVAAKMAASHVDHAFLSWQRVGAGRVAYVAAPEIFRLRFRRGDRMHHRFWGQMLRWMTASDAGAGSDLVRLQTDRTQYAAGENVDVTVWLKDAAGKPLANQAVEAAAKSFDDVTMSVQLAADPDVPGRYFGTLADLAAGAYQITARGPAVDALLPSGGDAPPVQATITMRAADNAEMLNTQSNRALLAQLAQITGGQVIPPTAMGEVLRLASFTPQHSEQIDRTPLWNRWRYLLIVSGCLITEWVVRKAKGLV